MSCSTPPDSPCAQPGCSASELTPSMVLTRVGGIVVPRHVWFESGRRNRSSIARPRIPAGENSEAHVPAQQPSSFEEARLPRPYGRPRWPQGPSFASTQGPSQAQRLIDSIRYRWEFAQLRTDGQYRRSGPLGLRVVRLSELPAPRVAFAIGKSVGNAVTRNKIRRRLREALRHLDQDERIAPGRYLIIVSPQASTSSFDDLRSHLSRLIGSE